MWALASPVPQDKPGLFPKRVADFEKQDLSPRGTGSQRVLHPSRARAVGSHLWEGEPLYHLEVIKGGVRFAFEN